MMGRDHSPVRQVFDYAQEHFLSHLPLEYVLTVTTGKAVQGLFLGGGRGGFEKAVKLSQEKNLNLVEPLDKVVVWLDPDEFKSTWLGNKAVYRTRMAIRDGGELIVLAPGVCRFGEDGAVDKLIRKYGYRGREYVIKSVAENEDLRQNMSAAAHLIHGSSDGRFSITYCTQHLTKEEVEGAGFEYMPFEEAAARFRPENRRDGFDTTEQGEKIYWISNPALGLWADKNKF